MIERYFLKISIWASLVAWMAKNTPAMFEPGFDPWVGKIPWKRAWQPIPVFLPGESHGQRSLVGCSPWGHKESDTTEWLSTHMLFKNSLVGAWQICWKKDSWQSLVRLLHIVPCKIRPCDSYYNIKDMPKGYFIFFIWK